MDQARQLLESHMEDSKRNSSGTLVSKDNKAISDESMQSIADETGHLSRKIGYAGDAMMIQFSLA